MRKVDIDEALKKLKVIVDGESVQNITGDKERLTAILDILETLGATESIEALRMMEAAKRIFDLVGELEYTAMAIKSLRKAKQGSDDHHMKKIKELMQKFPHHAMHVLRSAGLDCEIEGKELTLPQTTIGIRAAFDYYQRVIAICIKLDDEVEDPTMEEVLVQIESFARAHLKAFGWQIRGSALPDNMKQYIMEMQNLN